MKGCRPLTDAEVKKVLQTFSGPYTARNRALFTLGIKTGFRISELLSVEVGDVLQNGKIVKKLAIRRRNMKKKRQGRTVPLHPEAQKAIIEQIKALHSEGYFLPATYLFKSNIGQNKPISRIQAWRILNSAFKELGLEGQIGTHGMRKTFAQVKLNYFKRKWRPGNEIPVQSLQYVMGHESITSTENYIEFSRENLEEAFLTT